METFFGVEIVPKEIIEYVHPNAQLHLRQATLSLDAKAGERVGVSAGVIKDGPHVLLCSLREGTCESLSLDLILNSYAELKVVGNASVHLTGYYVLLEEHDQGIGEQSELNLERNCSPAKDPDTALEKVAIGPPDPITSKTDVPQPAKTERLGVDKAEDSSLGGGSQAECHPQLKEEGCGGVEDDLAQLNLDPLGVVNPSAGPGGSTALAAPWTSQPGREALMPQNSHLPSGSPSPYELPWFKNGRRMQRPPPREFTELERMTGFSREQFDPQVVWPCLVPAAQESFQEQIPQEGAAVTSEAPATRTPPVSSVPAGSLAGTGEPGVGEKNGLGGLYLPSWGKSTSTLPEEPATESPQSFTSKAGDSKRAEAQVPGFGRPVGGSPGHSSQAENSPLDYGGVHSGVGGSDATETPIDENFLIRGLANIERLLRRPGAVEENAPSEFLGWDNGTNTLPEGSATGAHQIFTSKAGNAEHAEAQVPNFGRPAGGSLGHSSKVENSPLDYKGVFSAVGRSDGQPESAVTKPVAASAPQSPNTSSTAPQTSALAKGTVMPTTSDRQRDTNLSYWPPTFKNGRMIPTAPPPERTAEELRTGFSRREFEDGRRAPKLPADLSRLAGLFIEPAA